MWTLQNWEKQYSPGVNCRSGLRLRFDEEVNAEVRRSFKEFAAWMRKEYYFPMRIPAYIKSYKKIKAMNGEMVYGTFFRPYDPLVEPYIRIAAGDFEDLVIKWGDKDAALGSILSCLAHELTHYFQWLNSLNLTEVGEERQATQYSKFIMHEYVETRDYL